MAALTIKQITGIAAPIDANYVGVHVVATFTAQVTVGSDWGASATARVFKTQNASQSNGDSISLSTSRLPFAIQAVFPLSAGFTIDVGLESNIGGAVTVIYYDVKVRYVLVKR